MEACKSVIQAMVISHLDYANALFPGIPETDLIKLRRIQHRAAKTILGRHRRSSSKEALRELHWLPVDYRADHKTAVMIFKALHGIAPSYLCDMICKVPQPIRYLRSSATNDNKLIVPYTKCKTFAARSFSVYGPKLWNSLPVDLRRTESLEVFKKKLKYTLFNRAFK
jgi:hypothetical protein